MSRSSSTFTYPKADRAAVERMLSGWKFTAQDLPHAPRILPVVLPIPQVVRPSEPRVQAKAAPRVRRARRNRDETRAENHSLTAPWRSNVETGAKTKPEAGVWIPSTHRSMRGALGRLPPLAGNERDGCPYEFQDMMALDGGRKKCAYKAGSCPVHFRE